MERLVYVCYGNSLFCGDSERAPHVMYTVHRHSCEQHHQAIEVDFDDG
jgi:hypothetical protein